MPAARALTAKVTQVLEGRVTQGMAARHMLVTAVRATPAMAVQRMRVMAALVTPATVALVIQDTVAPGKTAQISAGRPRSRRQPSRQVPKPLTPEPAKKPTPEQWKFETLRRLEGDLLATQAAIRGLILAQPDPRTVTAAVVRKMETLIAAALPTEIDDPFLEGIDRAKIMLLPSRRDLDECDHG